MEEINLVEKMIHKKFSLEQYHKEYADKLEWGYTDVLYSFLGVYVIGVNVFHKDKVECCGLQIKPKIRTNNRQLAYSYKFIKEHYCDYDKLNELAELNEFIEVYFKVGNIIPIWPGGNEHRGKSQCYDIPDIYFNKDEIKEYSNNFFNTFLKYKNFYLNDFINNKYSNIKIEDFLKFNELEYTDFLRHIVEVINKRSELIEKWVKEKVVF
ncbi:MULTISPECIES: hypothetical protein [unclassified Clostridium]|uniref:hypothetical protein n=1 Tax=unclassified Clostridium TaxID=2614128 RepID=UPI003217BAF1